MIAGRTAEKMVFMAIYIAATLLVLWGGKRMINYALDARFYREYLMQWEMQLTALRHQAFQWPPEQAQDPFGYMRRLVQDIREAGLGVPRSNTDRAFIYRIGKLGERHQQLLIIGRAGSIVIFGLSPSTFDHLDRFVDGRPGADEGRFTGRISADQTSRIGLWKI